MSNSREREIGGDDADREDGTEDEKECIKDEQAKNGKQGKRKLACMPCRDIKARCLLAQPDSAPQDPCKRCVRLGLQCVYTPKRRPTRYTKVGIHSDRSGDGQSLPGSPAAMTGASIITSNSAAATYASNPADAYSPFSNAIDPSLGLKYGHHSHANPRTASSGIWTYGNLSTGFGVAGEYDTSATRTSIQPAGIHDRDDSTRKREEDQPLGPHYSGRTEDYGMSATGSESESTPAIAATTLPGSHRDSSSAKIALARTSADITHRGFDNNSSTPAQAATGMDIVSDLSRMRSSAPGNARSTGTDAAYRLPIPTFGYSSTVKETGQGMEARMTSYERYYGAVPETLDTFASRTRDRKGYQPIKETPVEAGGQYRPHSLSMIVHAPPEDSTVYRGDNSDSQGDAVRAHKRRRTASPPTNNSTEKTKPSSTGISPDEAMNEVTNAGKYDAVRYDREEAEENGRGMDWISLMMRKRGGFEGTECPMTLGLVTEDDVRFLFDQYHNKLNTYVGLLDPSLHTITYVRSRSPILMTAICCAASQAYLPEKYLPLVARANFMIGRAFERADVNLELCQALSILSVWKDGVESTDRGAWLKVGQAIRIGYALGLDKPGRRPLPEDEFEARQIIDRERTWRQLSAFDRSSAQEVEKWLLDHPSVVCYSDAMQACSATIGFIFLTLSTHNKTAEDDQLHRMVLHNMQYDLDTWKERWLGDHPPARLHPRSRAIVGFYGVSVAFDIAVFKRRCFQKSRSDTQLIMEAANEAITVLEYIVNSLVPQDVLSFAPDIVPIKAARSAVFLVSHLSNIEPDIAIKVTSLIQEIADQFKRHSRGRDIAYYQHKFFSRLLSIATPGVTRHASRRPSLGPSDNDGNLASTGIKANISTEHDGSVNAANLVQHINFSLNSTQQDQAQQSRDAIIDDQVLMENLLLQSQDWFPLDLFTGTGGLL
ncbi:hypothetical protein QFC19_002839 [Naganishia cerealis]|uniref:Uncharacterized protein n=1 Tax=Naganishia cerealis TaxID=610337 RepID=A0ACC2W7J5_9TREE|nr:hypothetical protein QFC19_002839 [Naganishia cerealis]